jgi:hypothetical protein
VSLRGELQAIYSTHGKLTPGIVVEVARPKDHPLHSYVFDHNVKEAAEAWYRHRAHELITSVKIVYKEADETGPQRSVRAFHALQTEEGYVYEPVERIATDDFARKLLLTSMEREWKQLFDRYKEFEEFLSIVNTDIGSALGRRG